MLLHCPRSQGKHSFGSSGSRTSFFPSERAVVYLIINISERLQNSPVVVAAPFIKL
jgi:hypothetical protein